ncbi:MAG: PIN domain-containing protein [bacterium]|nr:PIN domain-containing protein [bacterium]
MNKQIRISAIDANIILRYLLDDNEELSARARSIMNDVESGKLHVACDPVNLAEVVWVLKSFYKIPNDKICASLESIIKAEGFILLDKDRYLLALQLFAGSAAQFGDACACAAALQGCSGRLLSFDRKLSKVNGIQRAEK